MYDLLKVLCVCLVVTFRTSTTTPCAMSLVERIDVLCATVDHMKPLLETCLVNFLVNDAWGALPACLPAPLLPHSSQRLAGALAAGSTGGL